MLICTSEWYHELEMLSFSLVHMFSWIPDIWAIANLYIQLVKHSLHNNQTKNSSLVQMNVRWFTKDISTLCAVCLSVCFVRLWSVSFDYDYYFLGAQLFRWCILTAIVVKMDSNHEWNIVCCSFVYDYGDGTYDSVACLLGYFIQNYNTFHISVYFSRFSDGSFEMFHISFYENL